jgi:L-iditol 2-dehydrogenase
VFFVAAVSTARFETSMKLWRYIGPQQLKLEEGDAPHPGSGQVVIRITACGVCATDLKTFARGHPLIPVGAVLGHEIVGVIAELGADVAGWQIGDRVAVAPYLGCGECYFCQRGHFSLCEKLYEAFIEPGGFAEFARVPARLVQRGMFKLNADVDDATGALFEPLACCIHGLSTINLTARDSLLIIGDGTMGLLQAELARHIGAKPIIVSGVTPTRLERAKRAADAVIDPRATNLVEEVKRLTNGYGVDKVMLSVADTRLVADALQCVARGGIVNIFAGLPSKESLTLSSFRIHYDEVRVLGTFGFGPADFRRAVELVNARALDLAGIVTRTVRFDNLLDAFQNTSIEHDIKSVMVTT